MTRIKPRKAISVVASKPALRNLIDVVILVCT
jgi:hypothetical protein